MKKKSIFFVLLILAGFALFFFITNNDRSSDSKRIFFDENAGEKTAMIFFSDSGAEFPVETEAETVADFFKEKNVVVADADWVFPGRDTKIFSGSRIELIRSFSVQIQVDGKKINAVSHQKNVRESLWENDIKLSRLDQVVPGFLTAPEIGTKIVITRINVEERIEKEPIDFKTITSKDSKLGWREKHIEQKGDKGEMEIKYKITYQNGKEISRKILEKTVIEEPTDEIVVQGTYMKIGKAHKGQGTWYAFKNGLFAASPWLPFGSFAKVTNTENGKSVVVEINDRGPFGAGRIIDLDKVAFGKIASLGAGIINVKVEEVLN